MKKLEKNLLKGFVDTHIHTSPDIRPRLLNDMEAASEAKSEKMEAIIIKCHAESTVGRAQMASINADFKVFGGICLNENTTFLNPLAVENAAKMGAKIIWLPTISYPKISIKQNNLEELMHIIAQYNMILATGHLNVNDIFMVLDMAHSMGIWKVLVNHPLTGVVGASIDEQIEMSRYGFLEHCYVACMEKHDNLDPKLIADSIKEIGPHKCIMATDFGQKHNPKPAVGMKMFVNTMMEHGISKSDIATMCCLNPSKLLFK
ncbi:MAG: DUF6282 family protein [Methanomicrobiales archaeon]